MKPLKVLIVEDDPAQRLAMGHQMESIGSVVIQYAETLDAVTYSGPAWPPDIVILDLVLDRSARDTIERIPSIRRAAPICVIVATSGIAPLDYKEEDILEKGADVFIEKMDIFTKGKVFEILMLALQTRLKKVGDDARDRIEECLGIVRKCVRAKQQITDKSNEST